MSRLDQKRHGQWPSHRDLAGVISKANTLGALFLGPDVIVRVEQVSESSGAKHRTL